MDLSDPFEVTDQDRHILGLVSFLSACCRTHAAHSHPDSSDDQYSERVESTLALRVIFLLGSTLVAKDGDRGSVA